MKKTFILLILIVGLKLSAQNFEGTITFKIEMINPNPKVISDSTWQHLLKEELGEKGFGLQKYYYKNENYKSEMISKKNHLFQLYNPTEKLLYSWLEGTLEATTIDTKKSMDEFKSISFLNEEEEILGVICNKLIIKTSMSEMTIWYNKAKLKMDASFYEGHIYGQWEQILKKINCVPLKIETKSAFIHMKQTVISYEEKKLKKDFFKLPKFNEITKSLIN